MEEIILNFHLPSALFGMVLWMVFGLIVSLENWLIEKAKNEFRKRKDNKNNG